MPALLAVGGGLSAMPAAALELGDLTVHSRLGQPLRASIAFALAPNEQLSDYCVKMRPGASLSGLPNVGPAAVRISNGVILLAGKTAIREPMVSAHVIVNCPYAANISREYMAFVDPVSVAATAELAGSIAAPRVPAVASTSTAAPEPRRATVRTVETDIAASSRYQVQPGESLSEIVSRIENRSVKLWPAVNAIFDANPDAFIDNDPNKLKAGSWLNIPTLDGTTPAVVAAVAAPVSPPAASAESVAAEPLSEPVPAAEDVAVTTGDLKPGDVVVDSAVSDNPFVEPIVGNTVVDIPDTRLDGPTTTSTSPNGSVAIITTPSASNESSLGWLAWLAGGGVALILALLLLGRRKRHDPEIAPLDTEATQFTRRVTDDADDDAAQATDVDFDLSDDSPTEENLALDADLIMGTGLSAGSEINVSELAFAKPVEVDVDLPFETIAAVEETDIISPAHTDELGILDSEVLPGDDDYDMSVIVDATQMPQPDDVTEKDLQAVEIPVENDTLIAQNYTVAKEVDYHILEQDYEDEMTATQALNAEIARAAADLAEKMDDASEEDTADTATTAMPLASVTELDVTAEMPKASNDGDDSDATVEMPADDETAEMQIESGKVG